MTLFREFLQSPNKLYYVTILSVLKLSADLCEHRGSDHCRFGDARVYSPLDACVLGAGGHLRLCQHPHLLGFSLLQPHFILKANL